MLLRFKVTLFSEEHTNKRQGVKQMLAVPLFYPLLTTRTTTPTQLQRPVITQRTLNVMLNLGIRSLTRLQQEEIIIVIKLIEKRTELELPSHTHRSHPEEAQSLYR